MKCKDCKWWKSHLLIKGLDVGDCCRHAPKPHIDPYYAEVLRPPVNMVAVYWPQTNADDFCGDFEPKGEVDETAGPPEFD